MVPTELRSNSVVPTENYVTIRAPALPSVLANDTNSRTDGKAGARMKEMAVVGEGRARLTW